MRSGGVSRPSLLGSCFYGLVLAGLCGCASGGSALVESFQMLALQAVSAEQAPPRPPAYNPNMRYLRAQLNDEPVALLVLGYVDRTLQGEIEVWYSANAEVLKLMDGRVLATQGLPLDWIRVRFDPRPTWPGLGSESPTFVRIHDELPSYRFGVREAVQIQAWSQTPATRWSPPSDIRGAKNLHWFKETARAADALGGAQVSWFARNSQSGDAAVVYSEQCLAPTLCLRLQRVPL